MPTLLNLPHIKMKIIIFHIKQEGDFKQCVTRIGRRLYIDLDDFEAFIDAQKGDAK